MYVVNGKRNDSLGDQEVILYAGEDHLIEKIDNLKSGSTKIILPDQYQQATVLYSVVKKFADLSGAEIVYDLYTGTGTIANFLAGSSLKVIGMEYVIEAVRDAEANSILNSIKNTIFFAGDIKDLLSQDSLLLTVDLM